ncbi:hypothetical protein [Ekhidna sp.]|uniref:hypothetical protein n=1 Tax=Ekhidna sp. TaxID=2608089 RepID=UPI003CCC0233
MKPFQANWIRVLFLSLILVGCKKEKGITFDELGATLRGKWESDVGGLSMNFISGEAMILDLGPSIDTLGYTLSDYDSTFPNTMFHLFLLRSCGDYLCPGHLHIRDVNQSVLHISEYCDNETCSEELVFHKKD